MPIIDIAILDYRDARVRLVSCDVPENYTSLTVERKLELLGYKPSNISYMTAEHIELLDEMEDH